MERWRDRPGDSSNRETCPWRSATPPTRLAWSSTRRRSSSGPISLRCSDSTVATLPPWRERWADTGRRCFAGWNAMASTQTGSDGESENVPDERAGQYARLVEIGRGAQSAVWLAIDEVLGREVALKEILPLSDRAPGSDSDAALHRFLREARITAGLDHPGIVPIHELARRPNGTLFYAQKLIRGETLKSRLAACDSLEARLLLLPHVIDACQAVAYAH